MMDRSDQADLDARNAAFWNELCGSAAARALGMTGSDPQSLAKFDRWFFDFYPYLDRFIAFADVNGKDVLEVGLGYGSVSQRLAQSGARFTGLDIAVGPVAGVNHRLRQHGLPGEALQGSILRAPFEDARFDVVVAIGCYHHTGNLEQAIRETARLLRPAGRATIMVYNATSYRRWIDYPRRTLRYVIDVVTGEPPPLALDAPERRGFDHDSADESAPETVMVSKSHFKRLLRRYFSEVTVWRTNAVPFGPLRFMSRAFFLATAAPLFGLDLYARVRK